MTTPSMCEPRTCPSCSVSLEGELIFETFLRQHHGDRKKALTAAEMYGATETEGRWNKSFGRYSPEQDRVVQWGCPSCGHTWDR